ncbi:hypothetical protein CLI70_02595 [Prevotella intermedia]|uniref:Uncharacterized protein n=2 Tax=Hoylesella TaxID=2974257 RepID=E0NQY0_9BACT|nr:hypothetical protein HMPREF0658_0581 [Hoylesella marshii DSM 16973 = JCM 13450]PDP69248.1 hypothetical protein CLI70_02595 [Prevotella intermedia]
MLIPFCSKNKVGGAAGTRFCRKILPEMKCRCGDFPYKPKALTLSSRSPLLPLRIKRNQHRLMAYQSGICGREKRKCNASMENEKGWLPQIEITTQKEE